MTHEVQPKEPAVSNKPMRRWFHFSIRDLLWLTVVVALAVAWWVEARRSHQLLIRALKADQDADSSRALSDALSQQLQNKNPAASIQITVNGNASTTSTSFAPPNLSTPAPKQPER